MGYTDSKTSGSTCGTRAGTDGTCGSTYGTCGSAYDTCGSAGGVYARGSYRVVSTPFIKKDTRTLVTGKPVFTDDLALKDYLVVKVLRSPYVHTMAKEIDRGVAIKTPGIEYILTWKDVLQSRFTTTGQTYPKPSPYDRLTLDRRLRSAGDAVAIVTDRGETVMDHVMHLTYVKYEVLGPTSNMHDAKDTKILMHPEEDWKSLRDVGVDNRRNLYASSIEGHGDLEQALVGCTHVIEWVYHTKANQQVMMETFRAYTHLDMYGRLNVVASTQIPFHARRILAHTLNIPESRIRAIKPRIGGGFGVKQTVMTEMCPIIAAWKTGESVKIIYSRYESQITSSPRHEMEVRVKLGCNDNGASEAMNVYTLSNTRTYGEHGLTTMGLSGHKPIPLYHTPEAFRFNYDVVYINRMSVGAYHGYGATQGIFTVESAVSELAAELGMDPVKSRELNMVKRRDVMPAYYGETADSCVLDRCMTRIKDMIGWDGEYLRRQVSGPKIRGVGFAMAMQGSSVSGMDVAGATIKINNDDFCNLIIGAADMGAGCDTILVQVVAECLGCELDNIVVFGADTDTSFYDPSSYTSNIAYLTGTVAVKTCEALEGKTLHEAVKYPETGADELEFDGKRVYKLACEADDTKKGITIRDPMNRIQCVNEDTPQVTQSHSSPISPPPFMVGTAEVEVDLETGQVELIKFAAAVDYGALLNRNLARVQTEDGLVQGIGMVLYEGVSYSKSGKVHENSFMQYKVFSRSNVGRVQVESESGFESAGPFGAKSTGEMVIGVPSPATTDTVHGAVGVGIQELPIAAERVSKGMNGLD